MAQDKRTFLGGMNKDVDTRLIKNPDYIDALNIRVASSADGTIGSVENIEGNKEVPFEFYSEGQDSLFINDNGLYQQVNPATVFYQKVVRIQGWESPNQNYSFTLYSITNNGDSSGYGTIPIGEFNWVGNQARTATTQYLYSQFSGVGGLNTGINVYDVNTNAQYTASVKLLSFGQNSLLNGGYLDIVIECDVAGVDFHLGASSNLFNPRPDDDSYGAIPDTFTYTFDQDDDVKITSSGDAYISLLSSFETGGVYNAEANDDGILISPEGQVYEMGNRTVWKIQFGGTQPTSPEIFDEVTIFSYRENLDILDSSTAYESTPFLTINSGIFAADTEYTFDATKTSLSKYLIDQFSEDKVILCDGLPLDFSLGPDNFFLTFSEQDSFDAGGNNNTFNIIIYGPVGVNFKLALADSSEFLHQVLNPNQDVEDSTDVAFIFNNLSIVRLDNLQIAENSISVTDSIANHINDLQLSVDSLNNDLINAQTNYIEQGVLLSNAEQNLADQIAETASAQAQVTALNADINDLESNIQGLETQYNFLENESNAYLSNFTTLNSGIQQLNEAVEDLDTALVPIIDIPLPVEGAETNFNELAENIANLITTQNQLFSSNQSFIASFNETFEDEISDAGQIPAVDAISLIIVVEDIIANLIAQGGAQLEEALDQYEVSIDAYQDQVGELTTLLGEATSTIASLQETIDNLVISDSISRQVFDNTHSTFTSINTLYDNTLSLYNSLSVTNQVIYEEDFGTVNSFDNNWILYDNVFSGNQINSLSSLLLGQPGQSSTISNPSGYEFAGYLKMPIDSNGYHSAVRLPWYSFDNSSAWQVGSEMTIRIEFDIVNTSTSPGANPLPSNYQVLVTNQWDGSNDFSIEEPYAFQESHNLTNGIVKNTEAFVHTFEVVDDGSSNFNSKLKNITIIADPLLGSSVENIEVRITNVRISNDSQEMFAFANIEPANNSRNDYYDLYSEIEDIIVEFDSSVEESIEEFLGSTDEYQEFLGNLIPGYIDGNSSLPALLDAFTADVVAFTSNVQNQFASRLEVFTNALNVDVSDTETAIQAFQGELFQSALQINELEDQIASLNEQLSDSDFTLDFTASLFDGPNFVTSSFNIAGPEPALGQPLFGGNTGQISSSASGFLNHPQGISFMPVWRINGIENYGDRITLVTLEEYNNLKNNLWSETNNICHYITSKFQSNQTIDIEIPGGQYPTQKCRILFVNFDENTNILDGSVNPTIQTGLDDAIYNQGNIDFSDMAILQMLIYFDETEGDNVSFSEDLHLIRFTDGSSGALLFLNNAGIFTKADTPLINPWSF
jgi:predicted  nucleic acid-binding Zn-ribbon protein